MTMGYGDQPTTGRWYVDENGELQYEPDTAATTPQASPYTPQGYDYYDYAPPPVVGEGTPYTPPSGTTQYDPVTGEPLSPQTVPNYAPTGARYKRLVANQAKAAELAARVAYEDALARNAKGNYTPPYPDELAKVYAYRKNEAADADRQADQAEKDEAVAAKTEAAKPTGLPNTPYLIGPDGKPYPNQYYNPPATSAASLQNAQTAAQTLAWNMARQAAQDRIAQEQYQQTHNWQLEAAERLRQQQVADAQALATARQRETQMARAQDLAGMYQNAQIQSLPYMARPGQVYQTGGEPGGFFEQVMKRTGTTYRPEDFRAPIVNIDPYAAWRDAIAAMQQTAQQQGGGQ